MATNLEQRGGLQALGQQLGVNLTESAVADEKTLMQLLRKLEELPSADPKTKELFTRLNSIRQQNVLETS